MCNFFSFVTNGEKYYYFNWEQRQKILKKQLKLNNGQTVENADSHSQISAYYNINHDKSNHYEYNFFKKELVKDSINIKDDYNHALQFAKMFDVKTIAPIIIKPIINPIEIKDRLMSIEDAVKLLKKWNAIRVAIRASAGNTIRAAIGDTTEAMVGDAIVYEVRAMVGDAIVDAICDMIVDEVETAGWNMICDMAWDTVWAAIGAYVSSFFDITYSYDFSSCIKLWEAGYIPSFNGKKWRLHGYKGKIVWKGKI